MKLKLIGYWNGGGLIENEIWPNPKHFVEELTEEEKENLLNYFYNGIPMPYAVAGVSECRLCKKIVGAGEFTDGKYVWPEGLPHYIKEHNVKLPEKFLEHALNNTIDPDLIIDIETLEIDIEWWKNKK